MRSSNRVILERDKELAALAGAIADAAAGHGTFVLVEGPAGIGKTTLLRAACALASADGPEVLTARGLALEGDFPYGIVRQLIEPVLAGAAPDDWPGLLDGAAGLAARVFDWAGVASAGDDSPYATMHGLYWLIANLAARRPLVIAVDDAHWADAPSLRWLAHLAERVEELPVALLLATRTAPDEPALLAGLRACPAIQPFRLSPLSPGSTTVLIREQFATDAAADLCRACHASTGGNPFLLESLAAALRAVDGPRADLTAQVGTVGPQQVARSVLRRVGLIGDGACRLARAVAVFGGPVPLRLAAILAGLELGEAARLADSLRAADVLAPGPVLEFAHPIVRMAIYESIPPGERALAHASTARLLDREGAGAERLAPHLLRSEPPATRGWWRCWARRPAQPAGGAARARPRITCAARWTSRPPPRTGRASCWIWDCRWPASAARTRQWRSRTPCGSPRSRLSMRRRRCSARVSWDCGVTTPP